MTNGHPQASRADQSNGLGLAGFIVSLIGFVSCGLISPIGLIMSIIAMKREPKGFAIAGLVLGILGSLWMLVVVGFVLVMGGLAAAAAAVGIAGGISSAKSMKEMIELTPIVEQYQIDNGALPTSVSQLPGVTSEQITDEWGNQYLIVPDSSANGFSLVSMGPDGQASSGDEIEFNRD